MCSAINKTLSDRCTVSGVRRGSEKCSLSPWDLHTSTTNARALGQNREMNNMYRKQLGLSLQLDVCGFVHHSINHKENPTRCNSVSKFYFIFIWSSTCFGRHNIHHQEPKSAQADSVQQLHGQQPSTYAKPEAASAVLGSWWWAVWRPKHVELHINMKTIFDTLLHLVGFSLWIMASITV
jgi:hypothetical protein